jgi:glycosyltransferase involved in cell wall biosynthesis
VEKESKYNLCILTTVSDSIKAFYEGQIEALNEAGLKTTVVCADDPKIRDFIPTSTNFIPVEFSRVLSPLRDIKALWKLYWLFRRKKFDIIQYSTPKASLLGSVAAFLALQPVRIYILWGLYYMGQSGVKRFVLRLFEKLICRLSTKIIPISHEMVDFALSEGLGKRSKYEVMLNGSACGVDLEKFSPEKWEHCRSEIRNRLQLPENAVVIGTVARLTGDKGVNELVQAFNELSKEFPKVYLLLVGEQEEKDRLALTTENIIKNNPRIRSVGWQDNPLPYYVAMDIFCLPTYREGFGEVNLEAQAMGLPVVSTNVIGPRESVDNGVTGFLVEPKNSMALIEPLKKLVRNKELRMQMGRQGRERVKQKFDRNKLIKAVVQHRLKGS